LRKGFFYRSLTSTKQCIERNRTVIMLDESAHTGTCDTTPTEDLDGVARGFLCTGGTEAFEESDLAVDCYEDVVCKSFLLR
jgi:hypothetical protein